MKKMIKYGPLAVLLLMVVSLAGCKDDDTDLTPPINLSYEPTMGGAIIKFTAPHNNDLLYIKAAYTNSLGKDVYRTTSIYDNKIVNSGIIPTTTNNENYTLVFDNYKATGDQEDVLVALEFQNGNETDFYGVGGVITKGSTFYLHTMQFLHILLV